ncbi:response regulator transcription factor [Lichenibacterium ramalinae]|uniref:DNA-binding response regulator n=1 Tax=Lichenibacterium ramalinae TaxID=2316527 RepID=A0A4Q2R7H2_9HYPH|nr:response regulator transcription factor [Lichenibacterium ramalinae]RYB02378.1 DNA-binding response regulator [Lichenibacterium ramalinae]
MAQARKILIVDDDDDLRATLAEQIACHAEFAVCGAASAGEADAAWRDGHPDLVILAMPLPDRDSMAMVRLMRAEGFSSPIIMLSGTGAEEDVVSALEAGANDCVSKPFRFAGLLARMRAHLRQHDGSEDASLQVGGFTFKPSAKLLVTAKGLRLRLTEKETAILRFLYRAAPQVVGRDVLLREVWGYNAGITTHTLETHIYRLRQKIEDDPAHARVLVTDAGGYRLNA